MFDPPVDDLGLSANGIMDYSLEQPDHVDGEKEKAESMKDNAMDEASLGQNELGFGSVEERQGMEKRLLWKLDCRMSILIVIYILNYVCSFFHIPIKNSRFSVLDR